MLKTKASSLPSITSGERFGEIPKEAIPRSSFNRSHGYKTTFNAGQLIPIFWDEVLPGDVHNLKLTSLARLATPFVPIMDNIRAETFFFFVPMRLLWDNWEKFNGSQDNPGDSTAFTTPKIGAPAPGFARETIYDYMGVKPGITGNLVPWNVNAFNFRAYNLIWNSWFRDENLQSSLPVNTGNGPDNYTDYNLAFRGRRYNYFTSALPTPQKGTALRVPVSNVTTSGDFTLTSNGSDSLTFNSLTVGGVAGVVRVNPNFDLPASWDYKSGLSVLGGTINELRQAEQLQTLLERDARGGTRYTEVIRQHFGVVSDDARLQRPEYLGGVHKT